MRRILAVLVVGIAVVVVLATSGISLSAAQPDNTVPWESPFCVRAWAKDWYTWESQNDDQLWWYFWWYRWCHDPQDGWFRVYDDWEWWGPVAEVSPRGWWSW